MARIAVVLLALATLAPPAVRAARAPAFRCMRVSGEAATECLAGYVDTLTPCRVHADATCESAAATPGGALDKVLARPKATDLAACTAADADALGFQSPDDVVLRTMNACGDYGVEMAAPPPGSADGAFVECRQLAATQLARLRDGTIKRFGPGCYLRERGGHRCQRGTRDHAVARLRTQVQRSLRKRCAAHLPAFGLDPLDAALDHVITLARHYAQQVYPPNDLGPTAELGSFPVGIRTLNLFDPARMNVQGTGPRPVTVEVYYPSTTAAVAGVPRDVATVLGVGVAITQSYRDVARAPGTFPLVVFSHGNGGIRIQSFFFAAHLASHGYVVVSPDHHGNTFVDALAGIVDPDVARNRPRDMSFVIDQFLAFNGQAGNFFAGAIDPARIGASGHSFGGLTVFALAGAEWPGVGTFTDARVKAIMPQAPATPFPDAFFGAIHVPVMMVGGSIDETTPFAAQQQRPFDLLPGGAPVVALGELRDAGHFTFSDFCEVDRALLGFLGGFDEACQPRHLPWRHAHDIVNYLGLNFFDATLKGDTGALGRLAPATVARIEDLTVQRK